MIDMDKGILEFKVDLTEEVIRSYKEELRKLSMPRKCKYCGKYSTKKGHDYCIKNLPNIINACCGHGDYDAAYLEFSNGYTMYGMPVIRWMIENGINIWHRL